jgi:hypothetical protein
MAQDMKFWKSLHLYQGQVKFFLTLSCFGQWRRPTSFPLQGMLQNHLGSEYLMARVMKFWKSLSLYQGQVKFFLDPVMLRSVEKGNFLSSPRDVAKPFGF